MRSMTLRLLAFGLAAAALTTLDRTAALSYDSVEFIPASGGPGQSLSDYHNAQLGLDLKYPSGWNVQSQPDKDSLVKIGGSKNNTSGEVAVSVNSDPNMTGNNMSKVMQMMFWRQLQNYKLISEKNIAFGPNRKLRGVMDDLSFEMNGTPIRQRYVFFEHGGRVVVLTFTSPAQGFEKLVPTYNDILLAVTPSQPGGERKTEKHGTEDGAWQLTRIQPEGLPMHFGYPKGWSVLQRHDDPDHPLEVAGQDAAGHNASIAVFNGDLHPYASVEQAIQGIEERYLKTKSSYRQTKHENISFGSSSKLDGIVHESSFEDHGAMAAQRAVFFRQGDKLFVLMFTSFGWKDNEANSLFHKILASVEND